MQRLWQKLISEGNINIKKWFVNTNLFFSPGRCPTDRNVGCAL